MPSLPPDVNRPPNAEQQAEFERQLGILVNEHKSYTSIGIWVRNGGSGPTIWRGTRGKKKKLMFGRNQKVIYNEGWGQLRGTPYPEEKLTHVIRQIDPSRLVNSVSGWNDHGFGDFSVSDR